MALLTWDFLQGVRRAHHILIEVAHVLVMALRALRTINIVCSGSSVSISLLLLLDYMA